MYWKHFIFVLLYGLALCWHRITASKPGYLDFDNLPETNFSCNGKVIGGYYADVETGCQMFHVCTIGQKGEVTDIKFLCLNGTVFDQETRVCERIDEVDCSKSEDFFGLNLELYGNSANFGIQPENEFECEDCSTDDDYDESDETTTFTTTTSTTTTTTTPRTTTTLKPTTPQPVQYSSSSPDTIAALIALHNAFNQGLQNSKIKPPPPRVINNAFSPTNKPSPKPYPNYTTQRPNIVSLKTPQYTTQDSQSYGSLNLQQRERPYFFTPAPGKSNYHHFQSGDASFGHSFDSTKPYNFQYFHSRRAPDDRASVSIVTSTSTSTSVKKSKNNSTQFPTGYEDYQEDIEDSFFQDVPKIRQKREQIYKNHNYETTTSTYNISARYLNHKYDDEDITTTPRIKSDREEFLQNLLGSIDFEDQVREKLKIFLKKEREEMDKYETNDGIIHHLGNKMETLLIQEFKDNSTRQESNDTKNERIQQWKNYFEDMRRDINLNYTFEDNGLDNKHTIREKRNARKFDESSKDLELIDSPTVSLVEEKLQNKRQTRRQNIDTERFNFESSKRRTNKTNVDEFIPVTEAIEGDVTTVEYRRTSAKRNRNLQRTTIRSRRPIKFNYEQTTPSVESDKRSSRGQTKEIKDTVHEESVPRSTQAPAKRSRGRVRGWREPPSSTEAEPPVSRRPTQAPDPNFSCEGKVKGGFYSDIVSDCRGFFICSQGEINGPLLKSHFWCGDTTKFNQRSRTCQAEDLVECSISARYFHLNDDFLVPVSEDELKGSFEAKKVR